MTARADRLLGVAEMILGDLDTAEAAAQEALVRCWLDLPALRSPDRFDAWLDRLLVAAVVERSRGPRGRSGPSDRGGLDAAFARLGAQRRASVVLRLHLGMNADQAAQTLRIPVWLARWRLHSATRALREGLKSSEARRSARNAPT